MECGEKGAARRAAVAKPGALGRSPQAQAVSRSASGRFKSCVYPLSRGDDFDGEAFEVTGLREGDEDRVIGALGVF